MSEVTQETAITVEPAHKGGSVATVGLTPRTFEDAWRFSRMIAMSDLAPKDYKGRPENVMVAIQMGAEVGLSPMAALQNIAVINGRPSLWGDAALAVVQVHPKYESHKEYFEGTGDSKRAIFQIKRAGNELHTTFFSVADARKANLWTKEGPWKTYPDRMLQMRARGYGLRDKFADALRGLSIAEEVMDIPGHATIESQELPALPETIQRQSEIDALPKEVAEAQAKLEAARTAPAEPAEKYAKEKTSELKSTADIAAGLPLEFSK